MENIIENIKTGTDQVNYTALSEIELNYMVFKFDSKALEELYNRYSTLLYSLINQITLRDEISDEILSDVFSIVWQHIDRFDFSTNNFYTWITTITRNISADYLRKSRDDEFSNRSFFDNYENAYTIPLLSSKIDALDLTTAFNLKEQVDKAITELPDIQKYIIHLVYYEGYTINSISKKLNIANNTVIEKVRFAFYSFAEYLLKKDTNLTNKNLDDIVFAYSVGCLDTEDYIKAENLINTLPDESLRMVGIFQLITSLFPIVIDLRKPGRNTKNAVAKKLLSVSRGKKLKRNKSLSELPSLEEIRTKRNFYEKYSTDTNTSKESKGPEILEEESRISEGTHPNEVSYDNKPVLVERINTDYENTQKEKLALLRKAVKKDLKKIIMLDLILVIIISVIISGGIYYFLNGQIKNDQVHITSLNDKIDNLNDEISNLHAEQRIFSLQSSKNAKTFALDGTNQNNLGFGKLKVSENGKEALLQLYNMPELPEGKVYQLWLISKGQPFSLGTFVVTRNNEDFLISDLPEVDEKSIDSFLLTAENETGASFPSNEVYLSRKLK